MSRGESERKDRLVLEILAAIDGQADVTQRGLAKRLDVALGLANAYLRRCVRKGLVKVKQAPANRYLYYLTPKGFAEKSRLTAEYLSYSFGFYRQASDACAQSFATCRSRGGRRVIFAGISELAEIATLRAEEHGIELVAVYDPHAEMAHFAGLPVFKHLDGTSSFDLCILTAVVNTAERFSELVEVLGPERIVVPVVLTPAMRDIPTRA